MKPDRGGLLLCLVAAAGFSTTGVFAKLAYAAHANVTTVLAGRFVLASVVLWLVVARARQPLPSPRALALGLTLGLVGYGLQVTLLFLSLRRIDASLSSLLFYSYPAMVAAGAALIGRERLDRRRSLALAVALAGVVLVFSDGGAAGRDGVGMLLSLAAALTYAVLILIVDALGRGVRPLVLATLVPTGAALAFVLGGLALGGINTGIAPQGWGAIAGLALLATVAPLVAFYAAVQKVGPSTASILLTVEPIFTVVLAALLLGERLMPRQAAGGALVLAAVVIVQARHAGATPPAHE